ncbi:dihydroorotase [Neiella marina]|uniref:Dihydroorotase n=1 Tax=Neiella marina TaxID=508461 RepID=A0A8J2XQ39_9GAMM|nr:dihydroorotase [Neiella marina]GGA83629.1 dihydroorotase [Neiella marina]
MRQLVIKNARIVNEGLITEGDVKIDGERIAKIASSISVPATAQVIDANGAVLMPGMIDDQVHFREPGMTHKGTIASESRAAVAGGITSYMEMPNVKPSTTTIPALEQKHAIAAQSSLANYSFYLGASLDNLDQIKQVDPSKVCGVKVFMGASTGDLLVDQPDVLEDIFRECPVLIATHCENGAVIADNLARVLQTNNELTIDHHPIIRDAESCYQSSSFAVNLAKRHGTQLNVLHITTARELELFEPGSVVGKSITAEACVHHLWFSKRDYAQRGNLIKCNPAIKAESDRLAILQAIRDQRIDIIATDHAPHTWVEKQQAYAQAPAGLPLVQHALLTLFEQVKRGQLTLAQVVEKTAHNPALRYQVAERGFIREGYFADLALIDPNQGTSVTHRNTNYLCQWSPFDGVDFSAKVMATLVNGQQVYDGSQTIASAAIGQALKFDR